MAEGAMVVLLRRRGEGLSAGDFSLQASWGIPNLASASVRPCGEAVRNA
jgi:hypothetical protein